MMYQFRLGRRLGFTFTRALWRAVVGVVGMGVCVVCVGCGDANPVRPTPVCATIGPVDDPGTVVPCGPAYRPVAR